MEQIQITSDGYHKEEEEVSRMDHDSGSDGSESESEQNNQDSESDCESETADSNSTEEDDVDDEFRVFTRKGFMSRVDGSSAEFESMSRSFGVAMGSAAGVTEVVAVHKFLVSPTAGGPRVRIFKGFSEAVGTKCGGNPNIRYGWYSGTKDEIAQIVVHGFGSFDADECGRIQLAGLKYALEGAKGLGVGDDGLRHMLLCRVIMGKMEELVSGSVQVKASSNEFDSGVDYVVNPRRYFVWSNCMNSHIIPVYVLSFKAPASLEGYATKSTTSTTQRRNVASASTMGNALNKPSARGTIPITAVVVALTRFLTPREMKIMQRLLEDFRAKKFDAEELKRKAQLLAGEKLFSAIKLAATFKGSGTQGGLPPVGGLVRDIYIPGLITVLAEFLPAQKIEMLSKSLGDFRAKKINRSQLVHSVKVIVGNDNVLISAINSYRNRKQRQQDK